MPKSQQSGLPAHKIVTHLVALLAVCAMGAAILTGLALPVVAGAGTVVNAGANVFEDVPSDLGFTEPSQQSVILAADGTEIARFYAENRIVVASDQIADIMKKAMVAIEDRRFYEHHGIDVQGLLRAVIGNASGTSTAGGSSITQQYVKNALIEEGRITDNDELIDQATERTLGRKINEARYAISLERTMTKDEILTGYLNLVQFGPSVYGVEAASLHYFSKHASDLTVAQAAMLAGITQSPAKWDPVSHPDNALYRRNVVLGEMYSLGYITKDQYDEAKNTPIDDMLNVSDSTVANGCAAAGISAYFCDYVVNAVLNDDSWGKDKADRTTQLYRGGLVIHTTLDLTKQQAAYDTLTSNIPIDDPSGISTAMSSVEPGTGHILAMAQNTNYGSSSDDSTYTQVNLNVSQDMGGGIGFQSGSTFKIFTLIEWLKQGHTAYEYVDSDAGTIPASDFTISCSPQSADDYTFQNLEGAGGGQMTVLKSTEKSVNGSFVHMAEQMDLCNIANNALSLGVQRGDWQAKTEKAVANGTDADTYVPWDYYPSMILGANNVTPLSMAVATASLAAEGKACEPMAYTSIEDADGNVLTEKEPSCRQVLDTEVARETTAVLENVVQSGATGASAVVDGREVAGKTGTANDDTDAWFVGYTPQLSAAIWQGHRDTQQSMFDSTINGTFYTEVYGGLFPAKMFSEYMTKALDGEPIETFTSPSRNVTTTPYQSSSTSSTTTTTTDQDDTAAQSSDNG
ncbi:MAG: penicillin-binding protein [Ancrocorticia sp.]|jgi:membrane peptidoglycan carboxypeptidase|nr:penicillin-binding protein [Ancrocorticia sp.]MCI2002113.1 penicillin-binding protein [Ancrocorticia sp.]